MIDDRLWELVEPLIPERPPPKGPGGRPRIDDRAALEGIVFVLSTGCRWRDLPQKGSQAADRVRANTRRDSRTQESPLTDRC
ncbi:transposase [Streptomyces sp. NPDC093990]|uniref:transposase n=1 Tax=Streptomyces sp. NPDC093990 TaxID=3155306 RepID=UPI003413B556